MSSRDDLRNFPGASWLRARSGHSRSPVGHRNFLPVDDRAVRFALHAVPLDVGHGLHADETVRILNTSVRDWSKCINFLL